MNNIIVIDTNVLLNDPYALYAYDDSEVVIPQTVLSELDKIKLGRADSEVRFRGREVSRTLFDLSQHGSLLEGIELDNGAVVRVVQHEGENFPATLNSKNGDDRILGATLRLMEADPTSTVLLLTNDLNMLLKAQALGIDVKQHEHEFHRSYLSRLSSRFRNRRLSFTWIIVPLVLIGLFISLWLFQIPSPITRVSSTALGATSFPLREAQYREVLKKDSSRSPELFQLGQLYLDWAEQLQAKSNFTEAREKRKSAVEAFRQILSLPSDQIDTKTRLDAKTSLGGAFFFLGDFEEAISQYVQVIDEDAKFSAAYFNLGFVLFNQRDFDGAAHQFRTYLELEPTGDRSDYARARLNEISSNPNN